MGHTAVILVCRWAFAVGDWKPTQDEWDMALSLLSKKEQADVQRFTREDDQKRAMGSRLLQRALISQVLGIPFREVRQKCFMPPDDHPSPPPPTDIADRFGED